MQEPDSDRTEISSEELPDAPLPELVEGREVILPVQGFGQLWRKRYRVWFTSEKTEDEVLGDWREHFDELWPVSQDFYEPPDGIKPGGVAVARIQLSGMPLVAGLRVIDSGSQAFTLGTTEGHMFAGLIRFSVEREGAHLIAEVQATLRASDPLYEAGLMMGGDRREDAFWRQTLRRVARRYGEFSRLEQEHRLIDGERRWAGIRNLRYNAAVLTPFRTVLRALGAGRG
jgi:hypothetical protein